MGQSASIGLGMGALMGPAALPFLGPVVQTVQAKKAADQAQSQMDQQARQQSDMQNQFTAEQQTQATANANTAAQQAAVLKQKQAAAGSAGVNNTVLTGPLGIPGSGSTAESGGGKTLLGG